MLGADEPRRYLLLFTNPSESRGLGGAIGGYAELTADNGLLTLTNSGQTADLDRAAAAAGARINGPAGFLDQYGRFGYDGGHVGDAAFRNLAMTPHFPWVGEIAASLYEQTTGRAVDGVILADPFVIAGLLRYTGPVDLPSVDQQLSDGNAVSYLLHDQYLDGADDNEGRHDALAEAATATFEAMMSGDLPIRSSSPPTSAHSSRNGGCSSGAPTKTKQDLLRAPRNRRGDPAAEWQRRLGVHGGQRRRQQDRQLPRTSRQYESTDIRGVTNGTLRIELTNTAPPQGLPRCIIGGGRFGLPQGTSRLYLSVYSALGLDSMTVNGERVGVDAGVEQGWNVYSLFVDIASGETVVIEARLRRSPPASGDGGHLGAADGAPVGNRRRLTTPGDRFGRRALATRQSPRPSTTAALRDSLSRRYTPLRAASRSASFNECAAGNQRLPAASDAGQLAAGVSRPERRRHRWRR